MKKDKQLTALIDKEWIKKDQAYGGYWYNGRPTEIHNFVYQIAQKYAEMKVEKFVHYLNVAASPDGYVYIKKIKSDWLEELKQNK